MEYKALFKEELVNTIDAYWTQNRLGLSLSYLSRQYSKRLAKKGFSLQLVLMELVSEDRLKLLFTRQDGRFYYPKPVWDSLSEQQKYSQIQLIRTPKAHTAAYESWEVKPFQPIPKALTADEVDALPDDETA